MNIYGPIFLSVCVIIFLTIHLLFERTKFRNLGYLCNTLISILLVLLVFNKLDMAAQINGKLNVSTKRHLLSETPRKIEHALQEEIKFAMINAPVIKQYPELPRGCEVTALAMLLQFEGVNVNKMQLANEIRKNPTPYKVINGQVYYGHPNKGFVGNMYNLSQPGLGVYHSPIMELAEIYLPNQMVDITGKDFREVEKYISKQKPVWVIINTKYKELSTSYFEKWITPDGEINITYKEHSVLITGFDEQFVYFNDPLTGLKNKRELKKDFIEAWVQMGSQAVSVTYFN